VQDFCIFLDLGEDLLKLAIGEVLSPARADEFVELRLDRSVVAVLRVLNEEDDEEGEDGRPRVDDEAPSVGEMEQRARCGPDDHQGQTSDEHMRPSRELRRGSCEL
jgi:hypothetical protein